METALLMGACALPLFGVAPHRREFSESVRGRKERIGIVMLKYICVDYAQNR